MCIFRICIAEKQHVPFPTRIHVSSNVVGLADSATTKSPGLVKLRRPLENAADVPHPLMSHRPAVSPLSYAMS